jgi:hypothetical protein
VVPWVQSVASAVDFRTLPGGGTGGDQTLAALLRENFGEERANHLAECGRQLAKISSQFNSMDEALHFLSKGKDIIELGKFAIAYEILKAERGSALYGAKGDNSGQAQKCEESWASQFLRTALAGAVSDDLPTLFDYVTVIDFNYDRILPDYLYWSMQRKLGISAVEAAASMENLRILHPYGYLGPLEWQPGTTQIPLGSDPRNLREIADRIKTYTEERDSGQVQEIRNVISSARVILVLGFGYHGQNIELLDLGAPAPHPKKLFMTVLGIPDENHGAISRAMTEAFKYCPEVTMKPYECSPFLQRHQPMISLAVG